MEKFNHNFTLSDSGANYRVYESGAVRSRLDFLSDSIIRVAVYNENEKAKMLPTFLIDPENRFMTEGRDRLSCEGFRGAKPTVKLTDCGEIIELGDYTIKLVYRNFQLGFYRSGQLLFKDRAPLAYNFGGEFGNGSCHYISREENEKIFGLGDKGGSLNKNGRAFRIEATDCMGFDAQESDPLYKHVPFYMCRNSVGSYGILYDTSDNSYFDFGKEINNYYGPYKYFKTEDNCLVYYVILGSFTEILKQLDTVCGKQAFPPKWSFDYCASTMAYTDADNSQELMDGFLKKLEELNFSCKGFYLSSGYTSIGPQRYVFNWNTDKFPSPEGFIKSFEDRGVHLIPNIKPAFLCSHPMYEEIAEKGLFVSYPDGTPFVTQFWDGLGSYLDFTNPEAFDFWKKQVKDKLLDKGMIATWNDNNEFDIKDTSAEAFGFGKDRINAYRIRNTLTYLMNASSYTAQTEKHRHRRPFLSSRCSTLAIRRLAQTWSGDNRTEFADLKYCNKIGLTMSLSGLSFYGHDLGGFTGDMPSRELLLRWIQLGVFQPRFTIHSWNRDGSATMPWSYEDIITPVRNLFAERKRLLPYLYNCAYKAYRDAQPINAPLFLYYPDESLDTESDSFMFGRDILVSPVLYEGESEAELVLPEGDSWYFAGKLHKGGEAIRYTLSAEDTVPFAVRAGSVIPYDEAEYGFTTDEKIVLTVYPVENGSFKSEYFDDDGEGEGYLDGNCVLLGIRVECSADEVKAYVRNNGCVKYKPEMKLCDEDTRSFSVIYED